MLRRIPIAKDTWISNKRCDDARGYYTGSNHGFDEALELYKKREYVGLYDYTYAKILASVDVSKITDLGIAAGTVVDYRLRLYNLPHGDEIPYGHEVEAYPMVSQSWGEGRGVDSDGKDDGYANWFSASSSSAWATSGAFDEYNATISASFYFEYGPENVDTDFSELVSHWLSGNTNYGFLLKLMNVYEDDGNEYWRKSFYSRHAKDIAKRPYVEVAYDDSSFDDRRNVYKDETSSMWMYRVVNGELKDFDSDVVDNVYVKIQDVVSGNATYEQHYTASLSTSGSYYAPINISSTGSYSGSSWHDIWYSGSTVFHSGTFSLQSAQTSSGAVLNNIRASVSNLKQVYDKNERAKVRVILEDAESYRNTILSASYQSNQIYSQQLYWGIKDDLGNNMVVPFNTGTTKGTRMGYDAQGHRTTLYMDSFTPGYAYRLVLYLEHNGERKVIDEGWRFKVV